MYKDRDPLIRLATYNVRCPVDKEPNDWPHRLPRLLALMEKHRFGIVGLQEATKGQIDDICSDGWNYVGQGRDDGKERGEYSCIVYRPERFEVEDSGTFWLSETPDVPGSRSWGTACTRICAWGYFRDRQTDSFFTHFNTHLDHRSKEAQLNGMKLILERIKVIAPEGAVILSGDFNVFPDSPVIALVDAIMHNVWDISLTPVEGPNYTYNAFTYRENEPTPTHPQPIDYIYVNSSVRVQGVRVLDDSEHGLYPSDHFPVLACLNV